MKIKSLLAAALLTVTLFSQAQQMQMPPVPVDPEVRTGKLANGLTYYVRHNDYPEHRVNFYIAQRVGSLQEEESQRGLAHFLEHMAFNGTEHFPGNANNGVIDYTRSLGVQFGGDLNAYTSIDQTVYNINDVPSTRQSAVDSCLLILKDWSNGLLLEDEEIDKERGVIHEEYRLRMTPSQRILERNLPALYPGSKYGMRMPIGLMSVVDGFKYNELRDYYHKWYHPENQCIIVVGDIDAASMEQKIQNLFAANSKPAGAGTVVEEEVDDNEEIIVVSDKDKEQPYTLAEIMVKHDPVPTQMKSTMAYLVMDYANDAISMMFNQRLSELALNADCPFLQAGCSDDQYLLSRTKDAFTVYFLPKEGKTEEALQTVMTEMRRVAKYGFTQSEYDRASQEILSRYETRYNDRNKISNEQYGRSYVSNYLDNEPIPSVEQEYTIMQQIIPSLPLAAVNAMVQEELGSIDKSNKNMVVMVMGQEKDGAVYPTQSSLVAAIDRARNTEVVAYVDNVKNEPLVSNLPAPGSIVSETKNDKLGYTELTLSNGVRVQLKRTDFKQDEILMYAQSKGGASLYGEADRVNLDMAPTAVAISALGEFDRIALDKAMAGKQASVGFNMNNHYETLNGSSTVKDLETMFQLLYLTMTDLRKDDKTFEMIKGQLKTVLQNKNLNHDQVFKDSVDYVVGNRSWRSKAFSAEDVDKLDYDRMLQIARERLANAADYTFFFVGSFDNDSIRKYLCQYVATLPASDSRENFVDVYERPHGNTICNFTRKMETPKGNSRMYWFSEAMPLNLKNQLMASIAGQVLDKIYLQKIREDASAAYSAGAYGNVSKNGNHVITEMVGMVPMKYEKADEALKIMREEMANLSKNIDAGTLAEIKALMQKQHDTSIKENNWWIGLLSSYASTGIDRYNDYNATLSGITASDIGQWVNTLLAAKNHIEVVMMPDETK